MITKTEIIKILNLNKQCRWNELLNLICTLDINSKEWMLKLNDNTISDKEKQELIIKWMLEL